MIRGSPCRPSGSDLRIPIPGTGNSRYPDVSIDCGKYDPSAHDASQPTVIFEVLSKSTRWYDQTKKVRDYASLPSVQQYICISQAEPRISNWRRDSEGKLLPQDDIVDSEAELAVVGLQQALRVADIYEGTGLVDQLSSGFKT
jgi:Uma2 family endonuclease